MALLMAYESVELILKPLEILFANAIIVVLIGLAVNGASPSNARTPRP